MEERTSWRRRSVAGMDERDVNVQFASSFDVSFRRPIGASHHVRPFVTAGALMNGCRHNSRRNQLLLVLKKDSEFSFGLDLCLHILSVVGARHLILTLLAFFAERVPKLSPQPRCLSPQTATPRRQGSYHYSTYCLPTTPKPCHPYFPRTVYLHPLSTLVPNMDTLLYVLVFLFRTRDVETLPCFAASYKISWTLLLILNPAPPRRQQTRRATGGDQARTSTPSMTCQKRKKWLRPNSTAPNQDDCSTLAA